MNAPILLLTIFLLSAPVFAQPDPRRIPPHTKPKPVAVAETSTETAYLPLDKTAAPCQLCVPDAPSIYGVKLGLTPDELGKALKIKIIPGALNNLEVSTFDIGKQNKSDLPKGINAIHLAFFNDRLFHARIYFDNAAPKQSADKFAPALSEKYGFSKAWFKTAAISDIYLFCPGEIRFTLNDRGYETIELEMLDLKADTQKNQRRNQINNTKPQ